MADLVRNDSSSVISSLQMDYGDSDEEDTSSRDVSRTDIPTEEIPFSSATKTEQSIESPASHVKNDTDLLSANTDKDNEMQDDISDQKAMNEIDPHLKPDDAKDPHEKIDDSNVQNTDNSSGQKTDEVDDKAKDSEVSPVDFISDDEDGVKGHHHHQHRHRARVEDARKQAVMEAVASDSPSSQGSAGPPAKKATRLVSYGPDEDLDEDSSDSEPEQHMLGSGNQTPEGDGADHAALSRSVQNMSSEDIKIPPEPPGKCSAQLQDKIIDMYERMSKEGLDLNRVIQYKKNFRNPSIYEKLIDYCHIDEKGTNFPPEIYDPHIWGKESFYDELDKIQRKDMERREKEKKERTKIEFLVGTKKSSAPSNDGPSDEKKRKTKWDAQPAGPLLKAPGVQNPGVVNLTATATGTKATVISAIGSLSRKSGK